jgi:hypothetical protein
MLNITTLAAAWHRRRPGRDPAAGRVPRHQAVTADQGSVEAVFCLRFPDSPALTCASAAVRRGRLGTVSFGHFVAECGRKKVHCEFFHLRVCFAKRDTALSPRVQKQGCIISPLVEPCVNLCPPDSLPRTA